MAAAGTTTPGASGIAVYPVGSSLIGVYNNNSFDPAINSNLQSVVPSTFYSGTSLLSAKTIAFELTIIPLIST